jgi:hypothetical protein
MPGIIRADESGDSRIFEPACRAIDEEEEEEEDSGLMIKGTESGSRGLESNGARLRESALGGRRAGEFREIRGGLRGESAVIKPC